MPLHIASTNQTLLRLQYNGGGSGNGANIDFNTYGDGGISARIRAIDMGSWNASLAFFTTNGVPTSANSNIVERMRIDNLGNIGIGKTNPSDRLHISGGGVKIDGSSVIEFGAGNTKEINNGKIGYGTFETNSLCIVGAGTAANASDRRITFWNSGGAKFLGSLRVEGDFTSTNDIISNTAINIVKAGKTWQMAYSTDNGGYYYFDEVGIARHLKIYNGGKVVIDGNLVIGSNEIPIGYKMAINGKLRVKGIRSDPANWSDYVFDSKYKLEDLYEVEKQILKDKHLKNMPSEKEVITNGIDHEEIIAKLLENIEMDRLYLIQFRKENDELKRRIETLEHKK